MPVLGTFPSSPAQKVKGVASFSPATVIFGAIILVILAGGLFWWQSNAIKDILADKAMQASAYEVDARFGTKSKCESTYAVLTTCNVYLSWEGKDYEKKFSFFDLHSGDYNAVALASPQYPDRLTLDLAYDKMPGRIAFSAVFLLFGIAAALLALYTLFIRLPWVMKTLAAFNRDDSQPWQLLALPVNDKGTKYRTEVNGKEKEVSLVLNKKLSPWYLQGSGNRLYVLGIAPRQGGGTAVALDDKLNVIGGLSKEEHSALQQKLQMQVLTAQTQTDL